MLTDVQRLAIWDQEMSALRATLDPADRREWDLDTAADRAGLVADLATMDDDAPAEFGSPVVTFCSANAPCRTSGDGVRRKGVIFRAGDYPEQEFALTPDELRELARTFRGPIALDHGHPGSEGPLDGTMGHLEAVEASPDGTTLYGTVAFARWLDDRLGDARRLVSAAFHKATKRLHSLSLVTSPIIPDTELLAAFASSRPSVGRLKLIKNLLATAPGREALASRGIILGPLAAAMPDEQLVSLLRKTTAGRETLARTTF